MLNRVHVQQEPSRPTATRWEQAYQAFETPEQELRKFIRRLRSIGADRWDRHLRIVEVCSGRGTGLRAWHSLGFTKVVGVDYSPALLSLHAGAGHCVLGDARNLPFESFSCNVAVVQGGLHHLLSCDDVRRALAEMSRVVVPGGRIVIIEPWLTPFLKVVHSVCAQPMARRLSRQVEALATMIEEEQETYDQWLNAPDELLSLIYRYVTPHHVCRRWGKLIVVGEPKHV
jgi:ubiquinone/menaquinone biosynthesis C-methylase UbiE